ncbi:hypothetical protein LXL04_025435 [Taraxacum kok-saghyz]
MMLIASHLFFFFFFFFSSIPSLSSVADTLAVNQSLSGNQTLVSLTETFELGFFKPGQSPNYYIAIWYKKVKTVPQTAVWVANRETPIYDTFSSKLQIVNGNLVLLDESNTQIWSTNVPPTPATSASVVLLDNGNLVLRHDPNSTTPIWQSFDYPTHTFLPGGKVGYNKKTNRTQIITSWKSSEDPASGLFSLEIDQNVNQYLLLWNRSQVYRASGPWDGKTFSSMPEMRYNDVNNFSYIDNENESYFTYSLYNPSLTTRFIIDISGQFQQQRYMERTAEWTLFWSQPREVCKIYGLCGAFGTCREAEFPCNCLSAFEPKSQSDWNLSDFSGGCVRKTEYSCRFKEQRPGFVVGYVPLNYLSTFLDNGSPELDESGCKRSCSDDCGCDAYGVISDKCLLLNSESLNNISSFFVSEDSSSLTFPFNIKVSSSDLPKITAKTNSKLLVAGIVSGFCALVLIGSIGIIYYRRVKRKGKSDRNLVDPLILSAEDRKGIDVPFIDFKHILSATDNFSFANKLGQGGFGPVYKGMLPGLGEVAIKRLASQSGQGIKEFRNEVLLIGKLQHRNLVRLLGYSMKDQEMILLYEYMPNKSLDRYIFDRTLCMHLDWDLRFDIIMGIARGLLYLHQDSRLRIIHRDLKASNVLLDEDMGPKISDFGLAKIVKGRETEANTTRVVGTYGYMSPEYVLDGLFSVKSDVFSFGVVVLEIISGKRNTGYYQNQHAFSLISYAWGLWKAKTPLDLVDQALAQSCNSIEVLRCMIVGLLCVQEEPGDRPTMVNVVLMLGMDIESLPDPKEPAFVLRRRVSMLPPSSGQSPNYYIGIWYKKVKIQTVVWVANRNTPIYDMFSSKLQIVNGNLVLLNESNTQIWSTNMTSTPTTSPSVILLDNGNLVLRHDPNSTTPIWQSFDYPTHTFLPGGKFGYNKRTNTKQIITSWKSTEDPGIGPYSLEVDQDERQYVIKWNGSEQYWASGSWNGRIFSGQIRQLSYLESSGQWNLFWSQPRSQCEVYAFCGPFGACSQTEFPFCSCLTAFKPTSINDWEMGDFSGGCVRKTEFNCSVKDEKPGFILSYAPVNSLATFPESEDPDPVSDLDESACRRSCLDSCSCDAYSFMKTCRLWNRENLQRVWQDLLVSNDSNSATFPMNIKVSSSDLPNNDAKINTKVLVAGIVSGFCGLVFLCGIGIIFYRRVKRQESRRNFELEFRDNGTNLRFLVDPGILSAEDRKGIDVPFIEFKTILSATNNFSLANKLGQGGFGPVYKGMLPGLGEVAVKRLASQSGQGLKEFKNEVVLIGKLQHRNLVRLLGYSMKDHEMMLLYEYMPNKSLDRFIFDRTLCMCLDWDLRFDIIMGIARGLLYLHQDSRLRIIHRDLKASNVLLDEDMNPKISDFGLAKIVKGRETEDNTTRVVGTYGYMSPEYALDGLFSVKSDVFSFGVVLLEIISGKRNTGYYHNQQAFSLISYAWGLWKAKTPLELVDLALVESCNSIEVLRCMIVGLLCIQEDPGDRPTMVNVVLMLGMDIESLPDPKEPAFVSKRSINRLRSSSIKSEINQLTITQEEGR